MVFIRVIRFLALGELRMIEPKFPFRQFFDFRFSVSASRFFNLPHPYPNAAQPTQSALSVAQLAAPTLFFALFRGYYRERI
jgi:hypothetical protein